MSESFILSLIFIGIIALIGYIGASFGVARGFVATASILGGAELALWWGNRIGGRLTDWLNISSETGRFLGATICLLATVLLVGIMGSLVLTSGTTTRWGATLGALLGAANGGLLIAMALRLYFLAYAGTVSNSALNDSIVTRILWTNYDWFMFGFLTLAAVLLLYTRFARMALAIPDPVAPRVVSRSIPPPVPRPDDGARPLAEARPDSALTANDGHARNGASAPGVTDSVDDAIYAPPREAVGAAGSTVVDRTTVIEVPRTQAELPSARNTVRFCPNCGMTLDASDRFCPDCGYTL